MSNKKSISIIIPNYNGKHLLAQYLPYTLQAVQNAGANFEIIVIDDASADDSVLFLQTAYPQVKVLVNSKNSGFSYTCNRGIKAAEKELILLLNSDVRLSPNYFDTLWKYFEQPDTFGVMGRIQDMNGTNIQDAARMPKQSGFKIKTAFFYYTGGPDLTLYLSGANALMDTQKLKQIGGVNELFSPFYAEDFELSLRAWRLNWRCYYEHQAVCGHEISASTRNYKTARWVKMVYFRNRYYLHALHLDGAALAFWFLQITLIDLLPKLLSGKFWLAGSYREFLKHREQIRKSRLEFRQLMQRHNSNTEVKDIIRTIKKSVAGKQITRLKT